MLAGILALVIALVTALSNGAADGPDSHDLPGQALAELRGQGDEATADSNHPETISVPDAAGDDATGNLDSGAPEDVPVADGHENQPQQPTVDTSNAPEVIDLGNVPAQENATANMPETVGANENADLPEQAGGSNGGNDISRCAKAAGGASAAEC